MRGQIDGTLRVSAPPRVPAFSSFIPDVPLGTRCCRDGLRADFCPFDEAIAVAIGEENGQKDARKHPAGLVQALCAASWNIRVYYCNITKDLRVAAGSARFQHAHTLNAA
jgi:hypothetical protein